MAALAVTPRYRFEQHPIATPLQVKIASKEALQKAFHQITMVTGEELEEICRVALRWITVPTDVVVGGQRIGTVVPGPSDRRAFILWNRYIDKGTLKEVFQGVYLTEALHVAIAVSDLANLDDRDQAKIDREILRAKTLRGDHMVRSYFCLKSAERAFFVMQFCPGGDLFNYIRNIRTGKSNPSLADRIPVALDITLAVRELHRQKVIHRDLKPENFLRAEDGRFRVGDFDSSADVGERNLYVVGTHEFMPPEIVKFLFLRGFDADLSERVSTKWDNWSLGVILFELLTAQDDTNSALPWQKFHPEDESYQDDVLGVLVNLKRTYEVYDRSLPPAVLKLLIKLIKVDPDDRLENLDEAVAVFSPAPSEDTLPYESLHCILV